MVGVEKKNRGPNSSGNVSLLGGGEFKRRKVGMSNYHNDKTQIRRPMATTIIKKEGWSIERFGEGGRKKRMKG